WMSSREFFSTFVIWDEVWAGAMRGNISTITGYKNFETFRNRAKDMFIRRRKEEVTDLLPKNYELRQIDFTREQISIEHELIKRVRESEDETMVLGLLQLLRVNASDPRALELSSSEFARGISVSKPSNKINEVRDICNETDCKIIVFTQFARVAELIAADLKEFRPFIVTGEEKDKDSVIQQFKADKDRRLLITTDTLAYGHSIDEADILIHYDTPYGLGEIMQREDRIHRLDSHRQKTIIYLFSGEVENHVGVLVRNKLEMYSKVVDGENDNAIVSSIFRYIRDK
ncbi:MAG: SWF/SNF helicase family protein, partial [Proteobacteria bacterium]|nr:SWF/SNF helicase family protein [Pseudomonadota bacterium]